MKTFLTVLLSALLSPFAVATPAAASYEVVEVVPPIDHHLSAISQARPVREAGRKVLVSRRIYDAITRPVVVELRIPEGGTIEVHYAINGDWRILDIPDDGMASFTDEGAKKVYVVHTRAWEVSMDPPKKKEGEADEVDPRAGKYAEASQ